MTSTTTAAAMRGQRTRPQSVRFAEGSIWGRSLTPGRGRSPSSSSLAIAKCSRMSPVGMGQALQR
jgi:hypothetical protein